MTTIGPGVRAIRIQTELADDRVLPRRVCGLRVGSRCSRKMRPRTSERRRFATAMSPAIPFEAYLREARQIGRVDHKAISARRLRGARRRMVRRRPVRRANYRC